MKKKRKKCARVRHAPTSGRQPTSVSETNFGAAGAAATTRARDYSLVRVEDAGVLVDETMSMLSDEEAWPELAGGAVTLNAYLESGHGLATGGYFKIRREGPGEIEVLIAPDAWEGDWFEGDSDTAPRADEQSIQQKALHHPDVEGAIRWWYEVTARQTKIPTILPALGRNWSRWELAAPAWAAACGCHSEWSSRRVVYGVAVCVPCEGPRGGDCVHRLSASVVDAEGAGVSDLCDLSLEDAVAHVERLDAANRH